MKRNLCGSAAAGPLLLLLAASPAAVAQKQGGTLTIGHFDSPASVSLLEESTNAVNRPMMGVFNNLVSAAICSSTGMRHPSTMAICRRRCRSASTVSRSSTSSPQARAKSAGHATGAERSVGHACRYAEDAARL